MKTTNNRLWVFYDRNCKICRRAVWVTGRLLGRDNVNFVPLQKDWVRRLFGLTRENWWEEMKLLTVDRRKLGGADAVLYRAGRVRWMKPIVAVLGFRWFRHPVRAIYKWVARKRFGSGDPTISGG